MTRLRAVPIALAFGLTWGSGMMVLGWVSEGGWGARIVDVLSSLYVGFSSTFLGGVFGGLWGFADGFLTGLVLIFFYNAFVGKGASTERLGHALEQPSH